jgi:phage-related minor tail protein
MLQGWGDTARTMRDAWDTSIGDMLSGAADQFGRFVSGQTTNLKGLGQSLVANIAAAQFKTVVGKSGIGEALGMGKAAADGGGAAALTTAATAQSTAATALGTASTTIATALTGAATAQTTAATLLGTAGTEGVIAASALTSAAGALVVAASTMKAGALLTSAKGNVFAGGTGLHAYANTVVSSPTVFAFANGVGLMGEAGAEAIMPLKRGPGGRLGVEASTGSSGPQMVYHGGSIHIDARSDQGQIAQMITKAVQADRKAFIAELRAQGVLK